MPPSPSKMNKQMDNAAIGHFIKKLKLDKWMWDWYYYSSRDVEKVRVFLTDFSKIYGVSIETILKTADQLYDRVMESIENPESQGNVNYSKHIFLLSFIAENYAKLREVKQILIKIVEEYAADHPNIVHFDKISLTGKDWVAISALLYKKSGKRLGSRCIKAVYCNFDYDKAENFSHYTYKSHLHEPINLPKFFHLYGLTKSGQMGPEFDSLFDVHSAVAFPRRMDSSEIDKLPQLKDSDYIEDVIWLPDIQNDSKKISYGKYPSYVQSIFMKTIKSMPAVRETNGFVLLMEDYAWIWSDIEKIMTNSNIKLKKNGLIKIFKDSLAAANENLHNYKLDPKKYKLTYMDLEIAYNFAHLLNFPSLYGGKKLDTVPVITAVTSNDGESNIIIRNVVSGDHAKSLLNQEPLAGTSKDVPSRSTNEEECESGISLYKELQTMFNKKRKATSKSDAGKRSRTENWTDWWKKTQTHTEASDSNQSLQVDEQPDKDVTDKTLSDSEDIMFID